jgi:hypothetical protein
VIDSDCQHALWLISFDVIIFSSIWYISNAGTDRYEAAYGKQPLPRVLDCLTPDFYRSDVKIGVGL